MIAANAPDTLLERGVGTFTGAWCHVLVAASALKTCPATLAPARAELCTGSGGTSKTLAPSHCYHGQGQRHPPHHGEPCRVGGGSRRRQPQQRSDSAGAAQGCPKRQHMGGLRPARGEPPPVLPRAARRSQCTAARVRAGRRRLLDESYWHKCHSLRLGCLWTSDR